MRADIHPKQYEKARLAIAKDIMRELGLGGTSEEIDELARLMQARDELASKVRQFSSRSALRAIEDMKAGRI